MRFDACWHQGKDAERRNVDIGIINTCVDVGVIAETGFNEGNPGLFETAPGFMTATLGLVFALATAGLVAAGLTPGFAFIDEPQKGQSSTSSSMTD